MEDTWGIHYQRWVQTTLRKIDPNHRAAGIELVQLADTLRQIHDYLGDLFIERIQKNISVKLGDFYKFQLGALKDFNQLEDWIGLEDLTHSSAFELLDPTTRQVIRDELIKRMDRWIRAELERLSQRISRVGLIWKPL
ncbi:MAG: hypothetical protein IPJ40_09045 [Saprospirales bacterium]|nr:hypothetical protein [Saprospirales bacterium]